jgi:hypothetical protein
MIVLCSLGMPSSIAVVFRHRLQLSSDLTRTYGHLFLPEAPLFFRQQTTLDRRLP